MHHACLCSTGRWTDRKGVPYRRLAFCCCFASFGALPPPPTTLSPSPSFASSCLLGFLGRGLGRAFAGALIILNVVYYYEHLSARRATNTQSSSLLRERESTDADARFQAFGFGGRKEEERVCVWEGMRHKSKWYCTAKEVHERKEE